MNLNSKYFDMIRMSRRREPIAEANRRVRLARATRPPPIRLRPARANRSSTNFVSSMCVNTIKAMIFLKACQTKISKPIAAARQPATGQLGQWVRAGQSPMPVAGVYPTRLKLWVMPGRWQVSCAAAPMARMSHPASAAPCKCLTLRTAPRVSSNAQAACQKYHRQMVTAAAKQRRKSRRRIFESFGLLLTGIGRHGLVTIFAFGVGQTLNLREN